jgi:hypothetical protein
MRTVIARVSGLASLVVIYLRSSSSADQLVIRQSSGIKMFSQRFACDNKAGFVLAAASVLIFSSSSIASQDLSTGSAAVGEEEAASDQPRQLSVSPAPSDQASRLSSGASAQSDQVRQLSAPSGPSEQLRILPQLALSGPTLSSPTAPSSSASKKGLKNQVPREIILPTPRPTKDQDLLDESIVANSKNFEGLSAGALEVAKDLHVVPTLNELLELRKDPAKRESVHVLLLRQEITESMLMAFLEVRGVIAAIDDEMGHTERLQDEMASKRDRAIRYNNIINFTSGGALAMLASGIQVGTQTPLQNTGNELEVMAGALSSGISAYALKQARGGKRSAAASPNMLAQILGRATPIDQSYPDSVWIYLNDPPPGTSVPRRELLIQKWVAAKRIAPPNTRAGQRDMDAMSGATAQHKSITIDTLANRRIMLEEVKAVVSQMTRDLLDIMKTFRRQ